MTYVSQYLIPWNAVRKLRVTDTYSLHRIVYSLFENVRAGTCNSSSGILFADKGRSPEGRRLVILSSRPPIPPELGVLDEPAELTEEFFNAAVYRFEITANPVRRNRTTGRREPIKGYGDIASWFAGQGERGGFSVQEGGFIVDDIRVDRFKKADHIVTLEKARISGVLSVVNPALFRQAVCGGIGHGKAFGCGLLQVAPIVFS